MLRAGYCSWILLLSGLSAGPARTQDPAPAVPSASAVAELLQREPLTLEAR